MLPKIRYRVYLDIISIVVLFILLYIVSDLIDFFPWGSSKRDGLVLLIIPFVYVPIFIAILVIDIFKRKLYSIGSILHSRYFWIAVTLLLFCVLPNIIPNKLLTLLLFLSVTILTIYLLIKLMRTTL